MKKSQMMFLTLTGIFGISIIVGLTNYFAMKRRDYIEYENKVILFNFQGCEYLKYKETIIHKGNCTNGVHYVSN